MNVIWHQLTECPICLARSGSWSPYVEVVEHNAGAYHMSLQYLLSTVFTTLFSNTQRWHRQGTDILPSVVCYEAQGRRVMAFKQQCSQCLSCCLYQSELDGSGAGSRSGKMVVTEKSDVKKSIDVLR
jgi:hypothetical protein